MLTRDHYLTTVERLKQLEKMSVQRNLSDSNLMRRFGLLRVEAGNIIVEKLVRPGTSNRFVRSIFPEPYQEISIGFLI